jgi:methionyl-tRNA formyltransferase
MIVQPARIIFAGSPEFAVPVLERLADSGHRIVAVLTQPDRPAGRGRALQASPVKRSALAHGLELFQPETLRRDEQAVARIRGYAPDLVVVVAYGLILPRAVLDVPSRGCVNIHASLLPRWRGAAPIQAAILAGDEQTGVALMRLDEGLDTGPVTASRAVRIAANDTAGDLHDRLATLGADLLMEHLDSILDGSARFTPQPAAGASYAPKLAKSDALINWREPAVTIERRIRAYNPWPVAETHLDGQQLRCWLAQQAPGSGNAVRSGATAGEVIAAGADGIDVQTGDGRLRLVSVQIAGRQRMAAGVFANGYPLLGKVLGK